MLASFLKLLSGRKKCKDGSKENAGKYRRQRKEGAGEVDKQKKSESTKEKAS